MTSSTQSAESARYALLRRLAPSMRHHLVVNLQPIGMIYEVMDRRLRADRPDLREVHESAQKINGFARAALDACLNVVTWIAPEEGATVSAADGVRECLSLLATSLTFRGFALRNEADAAQGEVRRSAMRTVLTAALLYTSDEVPPPAEIVLSALLDGRSLLLTLSAKPSAGEQGFVPEPPYRRLEWPDVQALAASESVEVTRDGPQRMQIRIPLAASAPAKT
ncbi:MAG: hypothetical protein ACXWJM_07495 [Ramlibacter sp.]